MDINSNWIKFYNSDGQLKIVQISQIAWALVEATPENNLPYRVKMSVGGELIRDGATIVTRGEDILNAIYSYK